MNAQVDMLTAAFSTFGVVHNVKLVRDKGGIAVPLTPAGVSIIVYVSKQRFAA